MYRILAALAVLLMPSMATAGTTWDTACDRGDGRIRGWNFGSADPRGAPCLAENGDTITSFRVEVPGTQFGKRRRTLTGFGERNLLVFPLGSSDPVFRVYLKYDEARDENGAPLGSGETVCGLYVDYTGNTDLQDPGAPGHLEPTFTLLEIVPSVNIRAAEGSPAGFAPELRQHIDTFEGHTLRTEDLFVQEVEFGICYGAGIFRYADDPRTFYER